MTSGTSASATALSLSLVVNPRQRERLQLPFYREDGKSRLYFLDEAVCDEASKANADDPIGVQIQCLASLFLHHANDLSLPPLDKMSINITERTEGVVCYYESFRSSEETDAGLFACPGPLLVDYPAMIDTMNEGNVLDAGNDRWWNFVERVFDSSITVFDDRFQGPGFWDFMKLAIGQGAGDFSSMSVHMQGLAVPAVERDIERDPCAYDLFQNQDAGARAPSSTSSSSSRRSVRAASKCQIDSPEALISVLDNLQAYTDDMKRVNGTSHFVMYLTFVGNGSGSEAIRKSICIVRLLSHDQASCGVDDYCSAPLLQFIAEEVERVNRGAGGDKAVSNGDSSTKALESILDTEMMDLTFSASRLTFVLRTVCKKSLSPSNEASTIFNWVVNLPEGTLCSENILAPMQCLEFSAANGALVKEAITLILQLQTAADERETPANRAAPHEEVRSHVRSTSRPMSAQTCGNISVGNCSTHSAPVRSSSHQRRDRDSGSGQRSSPLDWVLRHRINIDRTYRSINTYRSNSVSSPSRAVSSSEAAAPISPWLVDVRASAAAERSTSPVPFAVLENQQRPADCVNNNNKNKNGRDSESPMLLELPRKRYRYRTKSGRIERVIRHHITPKISLF